MLLSLFFTLGWLGFGQFHPNWLAMTREMVDGLHFREALMDILLSFLLFAGALHTDWNRLQKYRGPILAFATLGVVLNAALSGGFFYALTRAVGVDVPLLHCFIFGAIIAPTDPVAVLGLLKNAGAPQKLEIKFVGESLFNDGVGVVVFLTLVGIASAGADESNGAASIAGLFVQEVGGGLVLGLGLGWIVTRMMDTIDHYETEILLTLALVMGGYVLASAFHFSGPLAVVAGGLLVGNAGRLRAMSDTTLRYLDKFWELLDGLLNAVLFVFIGLEVLVVPFDRQSLLVGLAAIPIAVLARYLALAPPVYFFRRRLDFAKGTHVLLTWGGLRGGISIALALSLTDGLSRELLLPVTYTVVIFSIAVQGLSLPALVKKKGLKSAHA